MPLIDHLLQDKALLLLFGHLTGMQSALLSERLSMQLPKNPVHPNNTTTLNPNQAPSQFNHRL
jgi:hypothetical protein